MIYLAWKVLGTLSRFRWWDGYTSQNVFISKFFALSSSTYTNPLSFTSCNFYFEFESPASLIKAPTRRQYDRT